MWKFEMDENNPIYLNIANHIEKMILNQGLSPNDQLPSIRRLSEELCVNKDTVVAAYNYLKNKGYVYKVSGKGSYVKEFNDIEIENLKIENKDYYYDFSQSIISTDYFPVEEFKESFNRVLSRDKGKAFSFHDVSGYEPLRVELKKVLSNQGIETSIDNIMIISGAQQGIDIVSRNFLQKNECVFLENPTYKGAYQYFKSMGVKIVGIPYVDGDLDLIRLQKELDWNKPKLMYTMPNFQNPTGCSYTEATKKKLLELACQYNFYIIEDDYTNDINYGNEVISLKSFDKYDRVIYIKSFSKILMPGLRVSFVILPDSLVDAIGNIKAMTDIATSGILQRTLADFISSESYIDHIAKINEIFKRKVEKSFQLFNDYLPKDVSILMPEGGISFWLKLPEGIDSDILLKHAKKEGVIFNKGSDFFINKNVKESDYIRLSFGGIKEEKIEEGIKILSRMLLKCIYNKKNKMIIY
ncbi:MAG: PLP-dependent aminotransferase family protein [Clostridiales bacterium]|nr:PLP-dependent aminotransferase family protein [Clostridiales bacterium]